MDIKSVTRKQTKNDLRASDYPCTAVHSGHKGSRHYKLRKDNIHNNRHSKCFAELGVMNKRNEKLDRRRKDIGIPSTLQVFSRLDHLVFHSKSAIQSTLLSLKRDLKTITYQIIQ